MNGMSLTPLDISRLSPYLFWDTDKNALDKEKSRSFIIHRVLELGSISDWKLVRKAYGLDVIKDEAVKFRELDDVTLSFLSALFGLNKEDFRCYRLRQSAQNYWSY
jgi:hypothetical protein